MNTIANLLLTVVQPLAIIVFILAGLSALYLGRNHQAAMNLSIALANWVIFYGGKYIK